MADGNFFINNTHCHIPTSTKCTMVYLYTKLPTQKFLPQKKKKKKKVTNTKKLCEPDMSQKMG